MHLVPRKLAPLTAQERPVAGRDRAAMFQGWGSPHVLAAHRERAARGNDHVQRRRAIPADADEAFEEIVGGQARALVIVEARQLDDPRAALRATHGLPEIELVPQSFEGLADHRPAFDLPVRRRVLPVATDQDDRLRPEGDQVFLGREIAAAQVEPAGGAAFPHEDASALDALGLGADGEFGPGNLPDMVLQFERGEPGGGGGVLRQHNAAGGLAVPRQVEGSGARLSELGREELEGG